MNIEIKSRYDGRVLFAGDYPSLKDAVVAAVRARASLGDANLRGANLGGAYLGGAYLGDANLRGANLGDTKIKGSDAVVMIGPVGSRSDTLIVFRTEDGLRARTGCFYGTADDFLANVMDTHGTNAHANNYRNALELAASMLEEK